jgi:hypothetical protein
MSTLVIEFKGDDGVRPIVANISAEFNTLNQTMSTAKESGGGFFSHMLSSAGGFLAANIVGSITSQVSDFIGSIGKVTMEEQDQLAQLQAGLDSTGGKAGVTIEQLKSLAEAQATQTKFSVAQTEAIEKVGLTFTSINANVFPQTVQLAEDMSQRLGIQGSAAMTMLGKAMDDPLKGMAALHRVGVSFTDQQKDQVKALLAAGDTMGAQKIILAELSTEYGGSATAAGKTFSGQQEILAHQMDEIKVKIGTAVLPILGQLTSFVSANVVPVLSTFADWFAANLPKAIDYVTTTVIPNLISAWNTVKPAIDIVIGVVQGVIATFQGGGASSDELASKVNDLKQIWIELQPVITNVVTAVGSLVMAIFGQVQTFIQQHGADISSTMEGAWNRIMVIVKLGIELYNTIVPPVLNAIAGFITAHGTQIQQILTNTWNSIKAILDAALTLIEGVIRIALDIIHGDWNQAWLDLQTMSARLVQDLWTVIKGGLDTIAALFGTTLDTIASNFTQFVTVTVPAFGKSIIDGISSGISGAVGALEGAIEHAAQSALDAAKRALGIGSPSKVFADLVGVPIAQGIAQGIQSGSDAIAQALHGATMPSGARLAPVLAGGGSGQAGAVSGGRDQVNHFHIDARGSSMHEKQFEAVIRRVMDESGNKALSRIRTGN